MIIKKINDFNEIKIDNLLINLYNEFYKSWNYDDFLLYMKNSFNESKLPYTFLAINEFNEGVGICQIVLNDLPTMPNLYPWLANLYVLDEYRKKGIASILIREAINIVKPNFNELYLYTDKLNLYEKYNFKLIKEIKVSDYKNKQFLYHLKI